MAKFFSPKNHKNYLNTIDTQAAIKLLKDNFEKKLAHKLHLTRVSAPLFVRAGSGLNDDLNGFERAVGFDIKALGINAEIVHSLAKWKRYALGRYNLSAGQGIYADMNAIRRDEELDNIHSIYVDQWDWELIISEENRNIDFLKQIVCKIFKIFKEIEDIVLSHYPSLPPQLPDEIFFITSQELEDLYPNLASNEREHEIAKKEKAVFIMQIGGNLKSGNPHDGRAPDYDDWQLNGDIIFWNSILEMPLEMSSMGIRVDADTLKKQLTVSNQTERANLDFHKALLQGKLPQTIGGGIGMSRLCMFFLQKAHIGQVQASIWDLETINFCEKLEIELL